MLSTILACLLIAATLAHYVVRNPQDPNHFDTVGQVNFQGGHACKTKPKIGSASSIAEVHAQLAAPGPSSRRRASSHTCLSPRAARRSCAPPSRTPIRSRRSVPA
eukprot:scaffold15582_cov104-Isochrysis_galbana.AAC.4